MTKINEVSSLYFICQSCHFIYLFCTFISFSVKVLQWTCVQGLREYSTVQQCIPFWIKIEKDLKYLRKIQSAEFENMLKLFLIRSFILMLFIIFILSLQLTSYNVFNIYIIAVNILMNK